MKEKNNTTQLFLYLIVGLMVFHSLVLLIINFRVGQGNIISLGDLSAKRLFKSFDRAPEATIIAWGIFCVMLYVRYIIWKKRK